MPVSWTYADTAQWNTYDCLRAFECCLPSSHRRAAPSASRAENRDRRRSGEKKRGRRALAAAPIVGFTVALMPCSKCIIPSNAPAVGLVMMPRIPLPSPSAAPSAPPRTAPPSGSITTPARPSITELENTRPPAQKPSSALRGGAAWAVPFESRRRLPPAPLFNAYAECSARMPLAADSRTWPALSSTPTVVFWTRARADDTNRVPAVRGDSRSPALDSMTSAVTSRFSPEINPRGLPRNAALPMIL